MYLFLFFSLLARAYHSVTVSSVFTVSDTMQYGFELKHRNFIDEITSELKRKLLSRNTFDSLSYCFVELMFSRNVENFHESLPLMSDNRFYTLNVH